MSVHTSQMGRKGTCCVCDPENKINRLDVTYAASKGASGLESSPAILEELGKAGLKNRNYLRSFLL